MADRNYFDGPDPASDSDFHVAPWPTPYTSTILALEALLAEIDRSVGDFPSAEGIDLILLKDELQEIGERLVTLDDAYRAHR